MATFVGCFCWLLALLLYISSIGNQGARAWIPSQGNGVVRRDNGPSSRDSVAPIPLTSSQHHFAKPIWSRSMKLSIRKSTNNNDAVHDPFVVEINEKNVEEIDDEITSRSNDLDGLKRLFAGMEGTISNRDKKGSEAFSGLIAVARYLIRELEKQQASAKKIAINRVASITVGLDEKLKHDIDLREFERRVLELFNWYDGDQSNTYMAPYMPVIQSSGTGKTRLFMALREAAKASSNEVNYDCMTVLCLPDNVPIVVEKSEVYFDRTIRLRTRADESDKEKSLQRELIRNELQALLSESTKDKELMRVWL